MSVLRSALEKATPCPKCKTTEYLSVDRVFGWHLVGCANHTAFEMAGKNSHTYKEAIAALNLFAEHYYDF